MINFVEKRKISFTISAILFVASIMAMVTFGLRPGIDFTGGSLMEVTFTKERPTIEQVSEALAPLNVGTVLAQPTGEKGFLIRTPFVSDEVHQKMLDTLREKFGKEQNPEGVPEITEQRFETIGPSVSSQLKKRSIQAVFGVVLIIILYVAYSFRKVSRPVSSWMYGVAAILASIHDVIITLGIIAVLGKFTGMEITIAVVVALLTVLGYSVNDTMVAFDRIRENLIKGKGKDFSDVVNLALNDTLARSINTSFTSLVVVVIFYVMGGESIQPIALILAIGIFLATCSSVFVTSPLLVSFHEWRQRRRS